MTPIKEFWKLEREHRRDDTWFVFQGDVTLEDGRTLYVEIKAHGLWAQILRLNRDGIDYSTHTCDKVGRYKEVLLDRFERALKKTPEEATTG